MKLHCNSKEGEEGREERRVSITNKKNKSEKRITHVLLNTPVSINTLR